MEDQLQKYFMKETDRKIEELKGDIKLVNGKLDDLTKFKIEMIVSARMTSFVVSSVCGLLTLLVSTYLTHRFGGK